MTQGEILKLLEKEQCLTGTEIIERLRKNGEAKECLRGRLEMMRKYNEINFVEVNFKNVGEVCKKHLHLKNKIDGGYKVRRKSYLYYV